MVNYNQCPGIYILGAQSTGKTTLVNALEEYFASTKTRFMEPPKIIVEVARKVLKEHNINAEDITTSRAQALALQKLMLQAQLKAERAAHKEGKDWFISDRSGADPLVYAGDEAVNDLLKSEEWMELRESMKNSVVIICEAGADWLVDDGVRLIPESREAWVKLHELFCRCLAEWGVEYGILSHKIIDIRQRVDFGLETWEQAILDRRGDVQV